MIKASCLLIESKYLHWSWKSFLIQRRQPWQKSINSISGGGSTDLHMRPAPHNGLHILCAEQGRHIWSAGGLERGDDDACKDRKQ